MQLPYRVVEALLPAVQMTLPDFDLSTMPPATMSPWLTVAFTVVLVLLVVAIGFMIGRGLDR